jgi:DNA-binding response OmpR family regulator
MEKTAKILVVDDEARICHNVKKILAKNNFEVTKAQSAQEALEKMAKESFSLLISDIVMPGMNGLELLKMVKHEWPMTKAVMMTAYASTDTAVKAIQLGALDYLPKPFTPEELRKTVNLALSGDLKEAPLTPAERESINVIDIDMPFETDEVAKYTGEDYVKTLGRSDMPIVEVKLPEPLENYCAVGNMVCDIFKKLGATCKIGVKKGACPQLAKKEKSADAAAKGPDVRTLIGVDMPFSYDEVAAATGPQYIQTLRNEGVAFVPYEELKKNMASFLSNERKIIDVDMPFDRDEVAKQTGDAYADQLTRSDMPVVEVMVSKNLEHYCAVGDMVCDIFKKLGATCKIGAKKGACPQLAKKGKQADAAKGPDVRTLIGVDMPFNYDEVAAVTGPEYIRNLGHEGVSVPFYAELKERISDLMKIEQADKMLLRTGMQAEPFTKNILVIDDEVAVNNNIRKILAKKGFHVDQAVTKAEALEKITTGAYKLFLLDLKIPEVKGLELLKAIRDHHPKAKVIIITGYASIETAVESARMGITNYLNKPFTPDEIRDATENALRFAA